MHGSYPTAQRKPGLRITEQYTINPGRGRGRDENNCSLKVTLGEKKKIIGRILEC